MCFIIRSNKCKLGMNHYRKFDWRGRFRPSYWELVKYTQWIFWPHPHQAILDWNDKWIGAQGQFNVRLSSLFLKIPLLLFYLIIQLIAEFSPPRGHLLLCSLLCYSHCHSHFPHRSRSSLLSALSIHEKVCEMRRGLLTGWAVIWPSFNVIVSIWAS